MPSVVKINGNFKGKDILSLDQFDTHSLETLFLKTAKIKAQFKKGKVIQTLNGKVVTLLFYEPSSRTFASFNSAVKRIGGQTVDIQNPQQVSSVAKGETLEDTVMTFAAYSDAIVMRHPEVGSAATAAAAVDVPVINAGDGIGEHPTQALLDGFTIFEAKGSLDNLTGLLVGDLLNGRTVHSLIKLLSNYKNVTLYLLSPKTLRLKDKKQFESRGIKLVEIDSETQIPKNADFWYWTRVQKERFASVEEYEKVKNTFILTPAVAKKYAAKKTIFMHPLPRVGEIDTALDSDPRAVYFGSEIQNGMYTRMALLSLVLGGKEL